MTYLRLERSPRLPSMVAYPAVPRVNPCLLGGCREAGGGYISSMLTNAPVLPILLTKDLEASRDFYAEQLGLPIETESDSEVTFAATSSPSSS